MKVLRSAICGQILRQPRIDRKSTRLNSSHGYISYAVFCLKKKKDTDHGLHVLNSDCPTSLIATPRNYPNVDVTFASTSQMPLAQFRSIANSRHTCCAT